MSAGAALGTGPNALPNAPRLVEALRSALAQPLKKSFVGFVPLP